MGIHEEIEAEPYIHEEIAAEPYLDEQGSIGSASRQLSSGPGMDASFMFNAVGDDHEFMETADAAGERTGSYSYVIPEGGNFRVKYSAGKNGFVILIPREVLPQAPVV